MARAIVFGDSIAIGYYAYNNLGWVSLLNKEFMEKDLFFYNRAVSGHTSSDMKKYFETELGVIGPSLVIIAIGTNDCLKENGQNWVSKKDYTENINFFIDHLQKKNIEVVLVGFPNVDESRPLPVSWENVYYSNKDVFEYNQILKKISNEKKINFIGTFGLLENEDLEDGLHPNDKGHEKIYEKVKEFLIEKGMIK
jgi:lysophospholipase L1-like esterase